MKGSVKIYALSFFALFIPLLLPFPLKAQNVSRVEASQEGKTIVVSYYIDKAASGVSLYVSTDGGRTFSGPLGKVSGDTGEVQAGSHRIVWDVLSEMESFASDNVVFELRVDAADAVDLGLSVKWAACNLGASSPEDYGGYYQWAGTRDVTSTSIYWDNCPYHTGSNENTAWTKYIPSNKSFYWSGGGSPDNKTVLDPSDDAAHVKLGGSWRMPTSAEWDELFNKSNCTWTWTTLNGKKGYRVTSKKNGNSIFLPAAGYRNRGGLDYVGSFSYYWSSSLSTDYPYDPSWAYYVGFSSRGVYRSSNARFCGQSVRPVSE